MPAYPLSLIKEIPSTPLLLVGSDEDSLANHLSEMIFHQLGIKEMSHPDLMVLKPQEHTYSMEKLHHFIQESAYPPYQATYRYFVLHEIDKMQPVHINALLKTLEDLPVYARVLMTTTAHQHLLQTLLSRVMVFHIPTENENKKNPLIEAFFVAMLTDHIGNQIADSAEKIEEAFKKNKIAHKNIVDELSLYLHDFRFICERMDAQLTYPHLRSFFEHHRYPEGLFPIQRWIKALSFLEEAFKSHLRIKVSLEAFAFSLI